MAVSARQARRPKRTLSGLYRLTDAQSAPADPLYVHTASSAFLFRCLGRLPLWCFCARRQPSLQRTMTSSLFKSGLAKRTIETPGYRISTGYTAGARSAAASTAVLLALPLGMAPGIGLLARHDCVRRNARRYDEVDECTGKGARPSWHRPKSGCTPSVVCAIVHVTRLLFAIR